MLSYLPYWTTSEDYRAEWSRIADRERLASLASDDPDHFLPGDVAWLRDTAKAVVDWFATGLGDHSKDAGAPPYGIGRRQRHGA